MVADLIAVDGAPLADITALDKVRFVMKWGRSLSKNPPRNEATEITLLCSILGIRRKTAGMLLLFAGGFTHFYNYRQVTALAGLSPRDHTSGTSIRGKVYITKIGGRLIRKKFFICNFSAKKTNAVCAAFLTA